MIMLQEQRRQPINILEGKRREGAALGIDAGCGGVTFEHQRMIGRIGQRQLRAAASIADHGAPSNVPCGL